MTSDDGRDGNGSGFGLRSFLGGHPLAVFLRLAIISLVVGIVLSILGVTPRNFFASLDALARYLYDLGFSAFDWLFEYIIVGAMLVVPLWLVMRLFRAGGVKRD